MIRVLHLTRDFPPRSCGGVSTAVGGLVRAQAHAGHAVAVITFDEWRPRRRGPAPAPSPEAVPATAGEVPVHRVRAEGDLVAARAFATAARPVIIHVHDPLLDDLATELCAADGAAVVHTVHVLQRRQLELRGSSERTLGLAAEERALARAARVVAPSSTAAAALLDAYPHLAGRLDIVPHGIEDSPQARAAAERHRDRPGEGPLVAVGRFADVKGTDELFAALLLILARRPDLQVVVAGGIPANQRAERRWRARWEATTDPAVRRQVQFTGWLDAAAVSAVYHAAAAVLIPSRYESFGLVALEAMLHGVPIVATAAGALPELIEHDRTGLCSAVGDVAALAGHALALLDDLDRARRLSIAAAAHARAQHGWPRAMAALDEVYRRAAAATGAGHSAITATSYP